MKLFCLIGLFITLQAVPAFSYYDEFVIGSSADKFTLKKQPDGNYYVGNKKVQLGSFNDFIYLFGTEIAGACPQLNKKPDITIIAKRFKTDAMGDTKTNKSERQFFLDKKIVKGDQGCAPITGDGIYYLPMHKYWFTGETVLSLPKIQTLRIEKDGIVLAHVKNNKDTLEAHEDIEGMNWEFFNNFKGSLQKFPIFARLHPTIGKGKPTFTMTVNNREYQAYYVARNLWAMKFPKSPWLVASQQWSTWEDMRQELWKDRHFDLIQAFTNPKNPPDKRYASMQDLGSRWSPSIKKSLQKIIKNPTNPKELRSLALRHLKQKPSLDNFKAMIQALEVTEDRDLLTQLTKTLKIRNPKGPVIEETTADENVQKAIAQWLQWWKKIDQ